MFCTPVQLGRESELLMYGWGNRPAERNKNELNHRGRASAEFIFHLSPARAIKYAHRLPQAAAGFSLCG